MEIKINVKDDISLNEITAMQKEGTSVMRSAHVGNLRMYNLVLAEAGVDFLLVDHNKTGKDLNYQPEAIVRQDGATTITTSQQTISARTTTKAPDGSTKFLDQIHTSSLARVFETTNFITNTEYLRNNEGVVGEIVKRLVKTMPELFQRLVLPDGQTELAEPGGSNNPIDIVAKRGIMQLTDDPRSERVDVLFSNEVDIVCNFIIEALRSESGNQIHISGPDMIRYSTKKHFMERMQIILDELKDLSFAKQLPGIIEVDMIPGTAFTIGAPGSMKDGLEAATCDILSIIKYFSTLKLEKAAYFKTKAPKASGEETSEALKSFKENERDLTEALARAMAEIPDISNSQQSTLHISQYDLETGSGLYVPEIIKTLTVKELMLMNDALKKARKST